MANLETLVSIGETTARIAELEAEAETLRLTRGALMEDARKSGASLEKIGTAAGMTHAAVRKSIETFGRKSPKAKEAKRVSANIARRQRYERSKPRTPEETELARAGYRENYHRQKAGQSDRQE